MAIVLIVVFISCYKMMSRIEDRLFVSVDKFHIGKTERITIGNNSDVCYDKIPNDYLSVSFLDGQDSIVWEVNPHYIQSDSLCYLKINNSNPNRHDINSDDRISYISSYSFIFKFHHRIMSFDQRKKTGYIISFL